MPRPDVAEERQRQILEAATTVFVRMGFDKARMDDIARQARLSKGSLYWYFKSKDDIIAAILRRMFAHQLERLRSLVESEGSASDRLLQLAWSLTTEFEQMSNMLPIAYEFYAVAARNEPVREFLRDYFRAYREVASTLVRDGINSGEFRPDVSSEDVATLIAAIYEGLALLWMVDPPAIGWNRAGEIPIRLLLEGLKP